MEESPSGMAARYPRRLIDGSRVKAVRRLCPVRRSPLSSSSLATASRTGRSWLTPWPPGRRSVSCWFAVQVERQNRGLLNTLLRRIRKYVPI